MTRGQKTLLVVIAVVVLGAGAFAWCWQATAADRQVNALLDEVRTKEPAGIDRWLVKLELKKDGGSDGKWIVYVKAFLSVVALLGSFVIMVACGLICDRRLPRRRRMSRLALTALGLPMVACLAAFVITGIFYGLHWALDLLGLVGAISFIANVMILPMAFLVALCHVLPQGIETEE